MTSMKFSKVMVANRGAVASRVIRTLKRLNIRSVAVYSEADRELPYVGEADEAYPIGPASPRESYLNHQTLLAVAREHGVDAVHPGYGFLSENAEFAARVSAAGLRFIGPSPKWIGLMGNKTEARELMRARGMPVVDGSGLVDASSARDHAARIGYPLLVKPSGGGGGIGMAAVGDEAGLLKAVDRARALAERTFGDARVYLEKLVANPKHIEFQVLGDRHGKVKVVFERDCSVQRRHQKVVEECPAPRADRAALARMSQIIERVLSEIGYDNIGTVEMLMDDEGRFSFLEMNTRLQVEHGTTEMATGIDLVAAQIGSAAGLTIEDVLPGEIRIDGHAIEARVYSEDPKTFFPSTGLLGRFRLPESSPELRVDASYREGNTVSPHYDPMLAKVIAHGSDRDIAVRSLQRALEGIEVEGVKTNIPYILNVLSAESFASGAFSTETVFAR